MKKKGHAPPAVMDSRSAGGPVETVWSLMADLKAQQGLPAAMCTPSAPRIEAAAILRACSPVPTATGREARALRTPRCGATGVASAIGIRRDAQELSCSAACV